MISHDEITNEIGRLGGRYMAARNLHPTVRFILNQLRTQGISHSQFSRMMGMSYHAKSRTWDKHMIIRVAYPRLGERTGERISLADIDKALDILGFQIKIVKRKKICRQ